MKNNTNKTISQPASSLSIEGVKAIPVEAEGFTFNHTMLRIKDPQASLAFYTGILGMTLLNIKKYPDMQFDLYFLAKLTEQERNKLPDNNELAVHTFRQRGILELTHNYGTEDKPDFSYHDGNQQPQGFGHICFSVPNLAKAITWFDANDVDYQKRPEEGSMKNIAFIKDVDGYWIEIVQAGLMG